jgi:isochorismate hydrolase
MPSRASTLAGRSAFFPGKCDLKERLDALGIDTVLIAGAVTNVCCESSARDAAELDYKVIMVSDALSGHAHGLHEATLATFYRIFGDVRPSDEIAGPALQAHLKVCLYVPEARSLKPTGSVPCGCCSGRTRIARP